MGIILRNDVLLTLLLPATILSPIAPARHSVATDIKETNRDPFSAGKSCTSFVAGKLATTDGSVMAGHTLDGSFDFAVRIVPAGNHESSEKVRIDYRGIPGGYRHTARGETGIPQASGTFKYFHSDCPLANEHQVFFGENTCPTKKKLRTLSSEEALLDWTQVARLALQRGRTAREAIKAVGALIEKYGLNGAGESFLVSDPNEAWCFEIPGFTNEWVAQRIPDDHVCPHANRMRIGEIDLSNPDFFMASPNLIKLAQDKGVYDSARDGPFNFAKVYNSEYGNISTGNRRREWRMISLLCPSKDWDADALTYPLSVKPDKKISVKWWIDEVWRDHLEGTVYDKTEEIAAGPFGCPDRPNIRGTRSERSICIGEMAYSWVSQSRSWLPNSIGGVFWLGLDCPRSTCYVPFYVGISEIPESWQDGDYTGFSEESAWWYFQAIDAFSWLRYNEIHGDVRKTFGAIEHDEFSAQSDIEKKAVELHESHPHAACEYLTECSNGYAQRAEKTARDLFYSLIVKYRDGRPMTTVSQEWKERLNQK